MTTKELTELVAHLDALADWHGQAAQFVVPPDPSIHFHIESRDYLRKAAQRLIETHR